MGRIISGLANGLYVASYFSIIGAVFGGCSRLHAWANGWTGEASAKEAFWNGIRSGSAFLGLAGFSLGVFQGSWQGHVDPIDILYLDVVLYAVLFSIPTLVLVSGLLSNLFDWMTGTWSGRLLWVCCGYAAVGSGWVVGILALGTIPYWLSQHGLNKDIAIVAVIVSFVSLAGMKLHTVGKRMLAGDARTILATDGREHILLLRSFADDNILLRRPWLFHVWPLTGVPPTIEQTVARVLGELGPVLAIGHPREFFPPIGAGRMWLEDAEWQGRVINLLRGSRCVVMLIGYIKGEDGLAWEIGQLGALERPDKVVLLVLPLDRYERQDRWEQFADRFPKPLPRFAGDEIAVSFSAAWEPQVWRWDQGRGTRAESYSRILNAVAGQVQGRHNSEQHEGTRRPAAP